MEVEPASPARSRSMPSWILKVVLELLLITVAVFVALLADEWRERRSDARLAGQALQRFATEIRQNRASVERVAGYHKQMHTQVAAYLALPATDRGGARVSFRGIQPAWFEQTAWDVALATGALAHIDPEIVFPLARAYNNQRAYAALTQGLLNAMYMRPPSADLDHFLSAVSVYYDDIVTLEPSLLQQYDELLSRLSANATR